MKEIIENLKEMEQEAMDNVTPEEYDAVTEDVMGEYDQTVYQCGFIDGLQTAIRMMSENSETMSYSVDMKDIFPEDDEEIDENEELKDGNKRYY